MLTVREAAAFLGVKTNTLWVWEYRGVVKPPRRTFDNTPYYKERDLKVLAAKIPEMGAADLVSSGVLCFVELFIQSLQEHVHVGAVFAFDAQEPDAGGKVQRRIDRSEIKVLDALAQPLRHFKGAFHIGKGKNDHDLIASVSAGDVDGADVLFDQFCESF